MSDINLTQDQRDSYIEVITQILGVNAVNVTADNLDLEIITEVDNFIKEAQDCTKRIRIVTNLFKSLTDIRKLAFTVVKEIVKGIKNSFYSDATVVGIFLEDMEREYKRSTERSKEENIQVTRRDAVRNNSVREEVDVFLESIEEDKVKEKEKFNFFRWLKELF